MDELIYVIDLEPRSSDESEAGFRTVRVAYPEEVNEAGFRTVRVAYPEEVNANSQDYEDNSKKEIIEIICDTSSEGPSASECNSQTTIMIDTSSVLPFEHRYRLPVEDKNAPEVIDLVTDSSEGDERNWDVTSSEDVIEVELVPNSSEGSEINVVD